MTKEVRLQPKHAQDYRSAHKHRKSNKPPRRPEPDMRCLGLLGVALTSWTAAARTCAVLFRVPPALYVRSSSCGRIGCVHLAAGASLVDAIRNCSVVSTGVLGSSL